MRPNRALKWRLWPMAKTEIPWELLLRMDTTTLLVRNQGYSPGCNIVSKLQPKNVDLYLFPKQAKLDFTQ